MRKGYTTGTCAAAAARACVAAISGHIPDTVDVRLPRGDTISIPIKSCGLTDTGATCTVIKDGGDDPDVTHGADIVVEVSMCGDTGDIIIDGGLGVGVVTKPGLGLEIGGPAINPVPRRMIRENICEVGSDILKGAGLRVVVSVPTGERLAPKTDNPRLGIMGGISILGTSGIVIPFSTASFAAAIRQSLDVTVAMGNDTVVLATGSRSEAFAKELLHLPDHCFVQVGDFSGYTIRQCASRRLKKAYLVGFVGKLAKMAAGVEQTHVKGSKVDMNLLSQVAYDCGADTDMVQRIRHANTARHVMEMVSDTVPGFFDRICEMVHGHMASRSKDTDIEVRMFDFKGTIIGVSGANDTIPSCRQR